MTLAKLTFSVDLVEIDLYCKVALIRTEINLSQVSSS